MTMLFGDPKCKCGSEGEGLAGAGRNRGMSNKNSLIPL